MSETKKTVVFYTKDAGLTAADAKRMEESGFICVKVKDPTKINAPALGAATWMPVNDQMAMLAWKAMCTSSNARAKFSEMMIKAIDAEMASRQS